MSNFYAVVQLNKDQKLQFVFEALIIDSQTHKVINSINYYSSSREEVWQFLFSLNIPVAEFLPNYPYNLANQNC